MTDIQRADAFINSLGLDSYRVGGSVRDEIIGRPSKDADYVIRGVPLEELGAHLRKVCGSANKPHQAVVVKRLKLRDGRQAGWRVSATGMGVIEIVLPRKEISTGPGHRDFKIVVDPSITLLQDSRRRDFTFNALYKRLSDGEVLDPLISGLWDIEHRIVRTTHSDSFRDDPLRTLRALRFVATLGYDLSTNTLVEMEMYADAVSGLTSNGYASGTVLQELNKLLMGHNCVTALRIARDTGVLGTLLPELKPMIGFDQGSRYHDMTTDEHTLKALETAVISEAPLRVRMALLFHDSGKPETAWIGKDGRKHYYANGETEDHEVAGARIWNRTARRLGASNSVRSQVEILILNHMVSLDNVKATKIRRERARLGHSLYYDLLMMRACDIGGKGTPSQNQIQALRDMVRELNRAREENVPTSIKDLKVNGRDAMSLGFEGPAIGKALAAVLDEVIVDPSEMKRSQTWQLEALKRAA